MLTAKMHWKLYPRRTAFTQAEVHLAIMICGALFGDKVDARSTWAQHQLGQLAWCFGCSLRTATTFFRTYVNIRRLTSSVVSKKENVISCVLQEYKRTDISVSEIAEACRPFFKNKNDGIVPEDVVKIICAAERKRAGEKGKLRALPYFIRGLQAGDEKPAWMSEAALGIALSVPPSTLETPRSTETYSDRFESDVAWVLRLSGVEYITQAQRKGGQGDKTPDFEAMFPWHVTLPTSHGKKVMSGVKVVEVKNFLVDMTRLHGAFLTQVTSYVKRWGDILLVCRSRTFEATQKLGELGVTLLTLEELKLCSFSK